MKAACPAAFEGRNMSFGEELIQSATEALAIVRGEVQPAAVYPPETVREAVERESDEDPTHG